MELLIDTEFDSLGRLSDEESKHCVSVMRHRVGDIINVSNGRGTLYICKLTVADSRGCEMDVVEERQMPIPTHHLHMAVAPTKNIDRIEWFVEKATEMGISEITPIFCDHSERSKIRLDRLERIAYAAAKQSLKFYLPIINEPLSVKELIAKADENQRYILHCNENKKKHLFNLVNPNEKVLVLIGPEGDFSDAEIQLAKDHNFVEATLGEARLRTETAALASCHIVDLKNEI